MESFTKLLVFNRFEFKPFNLDITIFSNLHLHFSKKRFNITQNIIYHERSNFQMFKFRICYIYELGSFQKNFSTSIKICNVIFMFNYLNEINI